MQKQFGIQAAVITTLLALCGSSAIAAETDDLMNVTATVVASCASVDAPDELAIGTLSQGAAGEGAGNIVVSCGNGVDYIVAIEGGMHDAAGTRRMADQLGAGPNSIPYVIVSGACSSTTEVGTVNATAIAYTPVNAYPAGSVIPGSSTGTPQNVPVCAKVTAAGTQTAVPGTYDDQVRVVVAF